MQRQEASTVIGESMLVTGQLTGDQDMTVLGRVEGTIELNQTLFVDVGGIVKADVDVANAVISGIVVGNVTASQSVQVTETGRLVGDLRAPRIVIVAGARVRGQVEMQGTGEGHRELPAAAQSSAHKGAQAAAQKATAASAALVPRSPTGRFERLGLPQRRPMATPSIAVRRTSPADAQPASKAQASAQPSAARETTATVGHQTARSSSARDAHATSSSAKRSSRPKRRGSHRRSD